VVVYVVFLRDVARQKLLKSLVGQRFTELFTK